MHVLEAARKGRATQLDRAGPGRRHGGRGSRSQGRRTGGHAELGRAARVPEPQLQDPEAKCYLHLVPLAII